MTQTVQICPTVRNNIINNKKLKVSDYIRLYNFFRANIITGPLLA